MGIIYKATYKLDPNQIYIGKTLLLLDERRRSHERNPAVWKISKNAFDRILIDTGLINWEWEVLQDGLKDDLELDTAEKKHIQSHLDRGYRVLNITHNPDHPNNSQLIEGKQKNALLGAARSWDPLNSYAYRSRYFANKIKPVINLTTKKYYPNITLLRDSENISTPQIHKLCESGEPSLRTGYQYAFLDIDGKPILKDGHSKKYPIQQDVELFNMANGENTRCSLFEAARILNCQLSILTQMKHLNLGGNRSSISYQGFLVFAIGTDGKRVETTQHRDKLRKISCENEFYHVWRWDISLSQWKYEKKLNGYGNCAELLAQTLGGQPSKYKSKIAEILKGERFSIKGYSFTNTPHSPPKKPILKQQPVVWLNCDSGVYKVFTDARHAAEELDLTSGKIIDCCNGRLHSTAGQRFAYADKNGQPVYTDRHVAYSRMNVGSGKSVYWVQGDESFRSIAALRRRLLALAKAGDPRILFVPKAAQLSKIIRGEVPDEFGHGQYKFRLTLRSIR